MQLLLKSNITISILKVDSIISFTLSQKTTTTKRNCKIILKVLSLMLFHDHASYRHDYYKGDTHLYEIKEEISLIL